MGWRWGSKSWTCHLTWSAKVVKLLWWVRLMATVINFNAVMTRSPHNSSAAARPQRAVWLVIQWHVNLAGNQAHLFKSPPSSRLPTIHLCSSDWIQTLAANCCSPASRLFSSPRRCRVCHRSLPVNGLFMRQARGWTDWFFHYLFIYPFIVTDSCLLSIHICVGSWWWEEEWKTLRKLDLLAHNVFPRCTAAAVSRGHAAQRHTCRQQRWTKKKKKRHNRSFLNGLWTNGFTWTGQRAPAESREHSVLLSSAPLAF